MTDDLASQAPRQPMVVIFEYDPRWPLQYQEQERRIRSALGDRALLVEHCGSTSVPGLAAKPILDIVLAVADTVDEDAYVPDLEAAGYEFKFREPDWFEHRMLKCADPKVNLHVFTAGCDEIDRMLAFRDRLRADVADRELYERTKRDLAIQDWPTVQHYADAKTTIVTQILSRHALT